jgi:hypothetical protein
MTSSNSRPGRALAAPPVPLLGLPLYLRWVRAQCAEGGDQRAGGPQQDQQVSVQLDVVAGQQHRPGLRDRRGMPPVFFGGLLSSGSIGILAHYPQWRSRNPGGRGEGRAPADLRGGPEESSISTWQRTHRAVDRG